MLLLFTVSRLFIWRVGSCGASKPAPNRPVKGDITNNRLYATLSYPLFDPVLRESYIFGVTAVGHLYAVSKIKINR